ncbi:MAG: CPBP family intramembrane metalloprotease [Candidatus Heimdallarchaeota archaeon]|nr:CPBP family intramembrane metalloprotease [Candidatus Heimdallarchaeota archaeon]
MINFIVIAILAVFIIPAGLASIEANYRLIVNLSTKEGKQPPPKSFVGFISFMEYMFLGVGLAMLSYLVQPVTGLEIPFLETVSTGNPDWILLVDMILKALPTAIPFTAFFLIMYYKYYRSKFSDAELGAVEGMRDKMGLFSRVFAGGFFEEVVFRWGILGLIFAGLLQINENYHILWFWIANIIAGILFALMHLPGAKALGVKLTPKVIESTFVLNMILGLQFGWVLYTIGLEASIFSHALVHLVWYPIERSYKSKRLDLDTALETLALQDIKQL